MNQADKETQDWLTALSGQSVPDAKPEIVREALALQAELAFRREQPVLNPQILENVFAATGLKPKKPKIRFWEKLGLFFRQKPPKLLWEWKVGLSFATSILVGVIILYQVTTPLSPRTKDWFSVPQALTVPSPQTTAEELKTALAKLGIAATVIEQNEAWIVEVSDLSTSTPSALSALLEEYDLLLPVENNLIVRITVK
ncbi:MAG: hypothetical protein DRR19_16120 [Candidatus Parabeggiatoa sp. nov. 1]|nr:MAG: hypothetical protein DRR19_16120 [Gammaproteobacteria bacterium]